MTVRASTNAPFAQATLEYRLAFDLASGVLWRARLAANSTLLLASSASFVNEALLRLDGEVTIVSESPDDAGRAHMRSQSLAGARGQAAFLMAHDLARLPAAGHSCALWVAPQPPSWRDRARDLVRALTPGATLVVVSGGPLSPMLRRFRRMPAADTSVWLGPSLARVLAGEGLRREQAWSIGTGGSPMWAIMARAAALAGRSDLVDRAEAAFRQSLGMSTGRGPSMLEMSSFRVERVP